MSEETAVGNSASETMVQFLTQENGDHLAYHYSEGATPGVVFLHGLMSDMDGGKALFLEDFCKKRGQAFLRFDCQGHGKSSGLFRDGSLTRWSNDAVEIIDKVTSGPQILVGSSMGGWNMLLTSLKRKTRIAGLIGIAAAPDFTEDMMKKDLSADQLNEIEQKGYIEIPSDYGDEPYVISKTLLDDGADNLLLRADIDLDMPVRLIHGMEDPDVPWQTSLKIQEKLASTNVEVQLVKSGDHRLSTDADLDRLTRTLEALLRQLESTS